MQERTPGALKRPLVHVIIFSMAFTTFEQVTAYMERFTNLEKNTDKYSVRTYRLDRMAALLKQLGNPEKSFKTIHLAGSKGKGSTAAFIAHGLEAAGYRTGLYMSPHVSNCRERFTLCGRFVEDSVLVNTGNILANSLEDFRFEDTLGESMPTTFELYTAFAFLLFRELGCTWAVIETGLGGRLDATNVISPQASVLTPIELEHTEILGDTIEKIAIEKSKIIKPHTPVFTAFQKPAAMDVFIKEALDNGAPLYSLAGKLSHFETRFENGKQYVNLCFNDGFCSELSLKMTGMVQAQNCALALLVLRTLGLYRQGLTERALENCTLPGRMELVPWKRPLYLDGAHTEQSIRYLLGSFRKMYPAVSAESGTLPGTCIFGCVSGKRAEVMIPLVLKAFDRIVVSRPGTFKKSSPPELYGLFLKSLSGDTTAPEYGKKLVVLKEDTASALLWCAENTPDGEPVLACGSFYLAGAVKEALADKFPDTAVTSVGTCGKAGTSETTEACEGAETSGKAGSGT